MQNPLASDDPDLWAQLVEAVNPASLLVAIAARLGPEMKRSLSPEDILQDTLVKAWRARATLEWQGLASFRRWLLVVAEHCIEDERDRARAAKRGGERPRGALSGPAAIEPWSSTTPSRIAEARERRCAMESALAALPDDLRELVRLRLFEDLSLTEVSERLGLGLGATRHRFRKGAELYRLRLRAALGRSESAPPDAAGAQAQRAQDTPHAAGTPGFPAPTVAGFR